MTKKEAFNKTIDFLRKEVLVDGLSKEEMSKGFLKFIDGDYDQEANEIVFSYLTEFRREYKNEFMLFEKELKNILETIEETNSDN